MSTRICCLWHGFTLFGGISVLASCMVRIFIRQEPFLTQSQSSWRAKGSFIATNFLYLLWITSCIFETISVYSQEYLAERFQLFQERKMNFLQDASLLFCSLPPLEELCFFLLERTVVVPSGKRREIYACFVLKDKQRADRAWNSSTYTYNVSGTRDKD